MNRGDDKRNGLYVSIQSLQDKEMLVAGGVTKHRRSKNHTWLPARLPHASPPPESMQREVMCPSLPKLKTWKFNSIAVVFLGEMKHKIHRYLALLSYNCTQKKTLTSEATKHKCGFRWREKNQK